MANRAEALSTHARHSASTCLSRPVNDVRYTPYDHRAGSESGPVIHGVLIDLPYTEDEAPIPRVGWISTPVHD